MRGAGEAVEMGWGRGGRKGRGEEGFACGATLLDPRDVVGIHNNQ